MNRNGSRSSVPQVRLGATHVGLWSQAAAVDEIRKLAAAEEPALVMTLNMIQVAEGGTTPDLARAYDRAALATCDGWPVLLVARLASRRLRCGQRVTGSWLLPELCRRGDSRVVLIGGRGESAALSAQRLRLENPELDIVLTEAAPRDEVQNPGSRDSLVARIAQADADFVFIGLPSPIRERLALEVLDSTSHGVILCVGAAVEFAAGTVRRAPPWTQAIGMEWLWRIATSPRRLGPRYARAAPKFLTVAMSSLRSGRQL